MRAVAGLSDIADRFDAFLVDQYGVLHDGKTVFPDAARCLGALRAAGKPVVIVTNSGKRAAANIARLVQLGVPCEFFSDLISSGELTWRMLQNPPDDFFWSLGTRCYHIARSGDRSFLDGLGIEPVDRIDRASFILLSSLDQIEDDAAFAALLADAAKLRLPMVCSNPDTHSVVPDGSPVRGPGAAALAYREHGGAVRLIGKPYREIFDAAQRSSDVADPSRILMIGDSLAHDIAGGRQSGCSTLLVLSGIHGPEITRHHGTIDCTELASLCGDKGEIPEFIMTRLKM
jgi:HAD superfamily hydrolase (TIGR01459 family)